MRECRPRLQKLLNLLKEKPYTGLDNDDEAMVEDYETEALIGKKLVLKYT